MKKNKFLKQKQSRRVFNNSDDILQFEKDLALDGMSEDEIKDLYSSMGMNKENHTNNKTSDMSRHYYWPKKDSFVSPNEPGLVDLIRNNEVIPCFKYLEMVLGQDIKADNHSLSLPFEPIIFKSKGKTPQSVPYLQVLIESDLGDEDFLHEIHTKTFID